MSKYYSLVISSEIAKKFKGLYTFRKALKEGKAPHKINLFTVYENDGVIVGGSGAWPIDDTKTTQRVNKVMAQWEELAFQLDGRGYTLMASCNKDASAYLVPDGEELSYYGHPEGTIRFSDHWSWYSSEQKCSNLELVQCPLQGITSWPRKEPTRSTTPKIAICIAEMRNGRYIPISEIIT